jgi:hypothetical protein
MTLEEKLKAVSFKRSSYNDWIALYLKDALSICQEAVGEAKMEQDIISINNFLDKQDEIMRIAKIEENERWYKEMQGRFAMGVVPLIHEMDFVDRIKELKGEVMTKKEEVMTKKEEVMTKKEEFIDRWKWQPSPQFGSALFDCTKDLLADLDGLIDEACKDLLISMQPKLKELKDLDHKTATIIDAIQFGMDKQQNYEHYVYQKQIDKLSPSPPELKEKL